MDPTMLDIGMIITDRALIDPGAGDIAQIEGYGPVPVDCVREDLRAALREPADLQDGPIGPDGPDLRAVLRRLYTHPTTGELVAVESKARAFPKAMARFLAWRDTVCRGPHCNAVIRQSDHIRSIARGGKTSIDNGQGLCAACNLKEQMAREIERSQGSGHRVRWTSNAGLTRTTTPTSLTLPAPPQPEQPGQVGVDADSSARTGSPPAPDRSGPPAAGIGPLTEGAPGPAGRIAPPTEAAPDPPGTVRPDRGKAAARIHRIVAPRPHHRTDCCPGTSRSSLRLGVPVLRPGAGRDIRPLRWEISGPSGGRYQAPPVEGAAGSGSSDSVGRQPQRCHGRTLDDPGLLHAPRQQPSPHPARIQARQPRHPLGKGRRIRRQPPDIVEHVLQHVIVRIAEVGLGVDQHP